MDGHGLSRGNGIFEARRSRKAIIPKAVLIKAQPRYIAAMPHTLICPPPPRTSPHPSPVSPIVHSSATPSNPFHSRRSYVGIHPRSPSLSLSPILFSPPCLTRSLSLSFCPYTPLVDTRIFFIVPLFRARTRLGSDCGRVCVKGTIRLSGPVSLF